MLYVIFSVAGFIIGGAFFDWQGSVAGIVIGFLFGEVTDLKYRVRKLEVRLPADGVAGKAAEPVGYAPESPEIQEDAEPVAVEGAPPFIEPEEEVVQLQPAQAEADYLQPERSYVWERAQDTPPKVPPPPNALEEGVAWLVRFFTTGNVVAKIGVIILFFGVAFLLKFVAQRNLFPLEARLVCVAAGAIAMIAFGWRIRAGRLAYGLILQGGGIGILYLNLFATAKHYELMPVTLAFGIMVGLVVLSVFLAVLQDSRALAGFGAIGGFLAPVLMSTGSGSHIVLFSYYSLLNGGIFGVAWFKAWRRINLIGFVFTFVAGGLWGAEYYRPSYFMSVEPFLVLSFVFYVAISVLFAFRQPFHLIGYVDTTLVFGTPLVVFALQHGLVRDFEYGLAISALVMSAMYIFLAAALWRRNVEGMRLLTESFLALGVVFGSLAIPLALEGRWTTASWSLEGAALIWIGLRQKRILARNFGLLLIAGANLSFLGSFGEPASQTPVLNGFYLSCFAISMASLCASYLLYKFEQELQSWETQFHLILLGIGLLWWYVSGIHELDRCLSTQDLYNSVILFVSLTCMLKSLAALRLGWQTMKMPSMGLLPFLILVLPVSYLALHDYHPFFRFGLAAWGSGFATSFFVLSRFEKTWTEAIVSWWHRCSLWLLTMILTLEAGWWVDRVVDGAPTWEFVVFGLVPAAAIIFLLGKGRGIPWPVKRLEREYLGHGLSILVICLVLWYISACMLSGNPDPLPYIPLANPLEIAQFFVLFAVILWGRQSNKGEIPQVCEIHDKMLKVFPAVLLFFLLNALIARSVHHFGGIPYTASALFGSIVFHAAISISWSLVALFITFWATRKKVREVWFAGAALLSLVVVKLFLVDLASTGTVARIVSFLAVGSLMLLIGYLSPLPTAVKEEAKG